MLLERKHTGNGMSPPAAAGGGQGGRVARHGMENGERPQGKDDIMH